MLKILFVILHYVFIFGNLNFRNQILRDNF